MVLVRLTSDGDLDLSNPDPGGVTGFGIRAGLSVGNPCYWSMLSLVLAKTISKMKSIYETLVCFFYSLPSFALLLGHLTLFWFEKVFDISSSFSKLRCLLGMSDLSHLT